MKRVLNSFFLLCLLFTGYKKETETISASDNPAIGVSLPERGNLFLDSLSVNNPALTDIIGNNGKFLARTQSSSPVANLVGCNPNCRIASPARNAEWATVGAWADNKVNPAPLPKGGSDNLGCTLINSCLRYMLIMN